MPIIVDPVQTIAASGARSHIRKERFKTVKPAITYFNAASPIPMVAYELGVVASSLHRAPRSVFGRGRASYRVTVQHGSCLFNAGRGGFFLEAPTRSGVPACEARAGDIENAPALTLAPPNCTAIHMKTHMLHRRQASKSHSSSVNYFGHGGCIA